MDQTASAAPDRVCVIIPAFNAAATIGDAIRSALAEAEVAEIVVVDDASTDDTVATVWAAAAGDPRLRVIRFDRNRGPSAARNAALDVATSPWVAVLDSDDFVLPGRFARLMALSDADLAADNILFVSEDTGPDQLPPLAGPPPSGIIEVDLASFVRANLPGRDRARGEWGFLKPMMRRRVLDAHGLRYDEAMRLGEDYDLYVRLLQRGARFRVTRQVGYAARWRTGSLSARHRVADLQALAEAAGRLLDFPDLPQPARAALRAHYRDTRKRWLLRRFLAQRASQGRVRAVLGTLAAPGTLVPIARGVLADKLATRRASAGGSRIGQTLIEDGNG